MLFAVIVLFVAKSSSLELKAIIESGVSWNHSRAYWMISELLYGTKSIASLVTMGFGRRRSRDVF